MPWIASEIEKLKRTERRAGWTVPPGNGGTVPVQTGGEPVDPALVHQVEFGPSFPCTGNALLNGSCFAEIVESERWYPPSRQTALRYHICTRFTDPLLIFFHFPEAGPEQGKGITIRMSLELSGAIWGLCWSLVPSSRRGAWQGSPRQARQIQMVTHHAHI